MQKSKTMPLHQLEAEIRRHNKLYWELNTPIVSDHEYDELVEHLRKLRPNSPLLSQIGGASSTYGQPVKHAVAMLSMDKAYSLEAIEKWAKSIGTNDFIASPKMDGTACSIIYKDGVLVEASTRGSGDVGENVTENIKQISNVPATIPLKGTVEVRGEVVMPLSVFKAYPGEKKNPRNLAAGSLKQKNPAETGKRGLLFYAYNIMGTEDKTERDKFKVLRRIGFLHVEAKSCPLNKAEELYNYFVANRDKCDFEIDGVIFTANEVELQDKLGNTNHHPRYAIAWKIAGELATTTLKDVEWSISRTGQVTPVAIVELVNLSGAMVGRASLHNAGYIKKLDLTIGATIEMSRRGAVIPQVERVVAPGKTPVAIPTEVDGQAVVLDGDFLRLANPSDSSNVAVGKVRHYVKALDIDGFGDKILQQLHEAGLVTSPEHLYRLTAQAMANIDKIGEKTALNLVDNVAKARKVAFQPFLRSLGITDLGNTASKIVAEKYPNIAHVRSLTVEDLAAIDGIGEATATNIVTGLMEASDMLDLLLGHVQIEYPAKKSGILAGQSFVFTGSMESMGRKDAQKKVEALGADTPSSVSADLTYLVVGGDDLESSKAKKAQTLNSKGAKITILDEAGFLGILGNT